MELLKQNIVTRKQSNSSRQIKHLLVQGFQANLHERSLFCFSSCNQKIQFTNTYVSDDDGLIKATTKALSVSTKDNLKH